MDNMDNFRERFEALEQQTEQLKPHTHALEAHTRTGEQRLRWWLLPWRVAALGLALIAFPLLVQAKTFHCGAGDVPCLITAINDANANGQKNRIRLEAGTYTLTAVDNTTDGQNGLPSITSTLTIRGAGAASTSLERPASAPAFRLLHVAAPGRLTLTQLTLRGGSTRLGQTGGGLFNQGGTVTITHSTFSDNGLDGFGPGGNGGGLFNQGGTVTITHSTFSDNNVSIRRDGGGLYNAGGTVTLTESTLRGNVAAAGGGLFNDAGGTVTLTRATLANNTGHGAGGGIFNEDGGTVTITDSTLTANGGIQDPGLGGGILNGGTLTITNSTLRGNSGRAGGGGIYNIGPLTITHSTLADNRAGGLGFGGGGIVNFDGPMTITQSTLRGNDAGPHPGGGIENFGTGTITNSSLSDNTASFGGGGIDNSGPLTLTNSTLARNRARTGGGIHNTSGPLTLTNSTLSDNAASFGGGGGLSSSASGAVALQNTILARNTVEGGPGPDCAGPVTSLDNNLIGTTTGCTLTLQPSDITGDPGLDAFTDDGTPGNGHFPLLATSRAIAAANDAACPERDQLGRKRHHPCDIGAIEFRATDDEDRVAAAQGAQ